MIKLGWKAGAEQYPPGELLEYAVAADQAGFDLLDVSDHFHPLERSRPGLIRLDLARRGGCPDESDRAWDGG